MTELVTQQPGVGDLTMVPTEGMGGEVYARRSNVRAPEPNPNFSFPRLPQNPGGSSPADHPRKRIRPQNLSLLPKPSASDDLLGHSMPGAMAPTATTPEANTFAETDTSPTKAKSLSARGATGHRRGGSEFIGGDGSATGPGLMSTSPTKGTASLTAPAAAAGRRRGHAHRRSGAMSTSDFSAMINGSLASAPPLPGSAPATPSGQAHDLPHVPVHVLERHHSQPIMTTREKIEEANAAGEKEEKELAMTPRHSASRPRVGFSEKIEFIPRPLSTISTETTSTMSTVKPSHSANGSISSMLDQRPPTPVSTGPAIDSSDESRPTTSDTSSQPDIFGPIDDDVVMIMERPSSASGKALFSKKRRSPPPTFEDDGVSPGTLVEPQFYSNWNADPLPSPGAISVGSNGSASSPSKEGRHEKKKSRIRSILLRNSRKRSKEDVPTESSTIATTDVSGPNVPAGLISLDDVNFDEDTSLVIHSADYKEPVPAPYQPSPRAEVFDKDDNAVLDLDATYNSVTIAEDSPQSFANIMRGTLPTRSHRRTESAPSLSPVQRQVFAPAFGPGKISPQMADVFEEDEEDDSLQRAQRPKARSFHQPKRGNLQGLGVQIVDAEMGEGAQPRRKSRSPSSKAVVSERSTGPQQGVRTAPDFPKTELPIDTAELNNEPRFSMATKSSDEETITPTALEASPRRPSPSLAIDTTFSKPLSASTQPFDFAPPPSLIPHAHHDSSDFSTSSTAPSPNPTTISFDAPRLNTAASSITIQSQHVSSANTPACRGDDSAMSDDVPSLTSASTMLSGNLSNPSASTNTSSASPSPVVARGSGAGAFGAPAYHAHTFSGIQRPTTSFVPDNNNTRPSSVGAERAFSVAAGLGGLSTRPSMPRPWGSARPNTAHGSKRSSLASLSRFMSRGNESERSKLSTSWGASEGGDGTQGGVISAKEGKDKGGKRRLSRMLKFWKGKDKEREQSVESGPIHDRQDDVEMSVD